MEMIVKRQFNFRVLFKNHMFDLVNVNFLLYSIKLRMILNILAAVEPGRLATWVV